MNPLIILLVFLAYTILIFIVAGITGRKGDNRNFFIGNKTSPWVVVAYGMIGASLSGVTFISVPGWVGSTQFSYLVVVMGYLVGYWIIAGILLPVYYRLNLISIYTYLHKRFGLSSYMTGASLFMVSRVIGASLRMFIVVNVLHIFVFERWNVPFFLSALIFVILILLYTLRGGIKTIVWTDILQTTFMLASVVATIIIIVNKMDVSITDLIRKADESDYLRMVYSDWKDKRFFLKQFFSGVFIAIVMTGLDQEMMQKNLSCRNLRQAQKNMVTFSLSLFPVNMMFLFLGAVLYIYAAANGIQVPERSDDLFPILALEYLGPVTGIIFLIGIISAAYPSADGALTSLTTSFSVDILGFERRKELSEAVKLRTRYFVHVSFAFILLAAIVFFRSINNEAVINQIFTIAGYTYGPLLGMFSFGLLTHRAVKDKYVPWIAVISPAVCYLLSLNSVSWLNGYKFGFELLILNGLITFAGLWMISRPGIKQAEDDVTGHLA